MTYRAIRLYFVCNHCDATIQKDLPRISPKIEINVREYQKQVFIHDCTKTEGYSAGMFGVMEIVGGKEI